MESNRKKLAAFACYKSIAFCGEKNKRIAKLNGLKTNYFFFFRWVFFFVGHYIGQNFEFGNVKHNLEMHSIIMLKSIKRKISQFLFLVQKSVNLLEISFSHIKKHFFVKSNVIIVPHRLNQKAYFPYFINTVSLIELKIVLPVFLSSIDQRVSNSICCFWQQAKSRCDLHNHNPFTYTKAEIL